MLTTLLLGVESWVTYRRYLRLTELYHQRCLRIIHLSDYHQHRIPYEMAKVTSIAAMLVKTLLRWAGYVSRMEEHRLTKIVLYGELSIGHRGRGTLKILWRVPSPLVKPIAVNGQRDVNWRLKGHHFLWKPHEGPTWKTKGPRTDRDVQPLWNDLPISDTFLQPSACFHQTRASSLLNLRSRRRTITTMMMSSNVNVSL